MRILYAAKTQIPSRTANSIHVMKIAAAFAAQGHQVRLTTPRLPGTEPDVQNIFDFYGVPKTFELSWLPWPKIKGQNLILAYLFARQASVMNADLVYGRYLAACWGAAMAGFPVVFEAHTSLENFPRSDRMLFKLLIKNRNFKRLVVISEALKKWFLENYPSLYGRVLVAHDGADLPGDIMPENLERQGRFLAGYVGSLFPGKGMELIAELVPLCPETDFYILGGSDSEIADWKKRLSAHDNIFFIGFVAPSKAEAYRKAMDVLLAPFQEKVMILGKSDISRWMSPLKIFEYMASEKPIVASDLHVLREVLNDENSILVKADDVQAWRAALNKLRSDETFCLQLSRRAHEDFCARYTWEQRARQILAGVK